FPQYTSLTADSARLPEGKARYDSLQIKSTKRFSNGLSALAFVSFMKNRSNTPNGVQYPGDRGTLGFDPGVPPVTFSASWGYELPFGEGRRFMTSSSPLVSRLVSGWSINGSVRYASGAALQITTTNNLAALGYPTKLADRVNGIDPHLKGRSGFDPAT